MDRSIDFTPFQQPAPQLANQFDADKPLQSSPRGKYMIISAGKDGIFFSNQDGPGTKKAPITDIVTSAGITKMGGLGALDNYDDIKVFGGG